MPGRIAGEIRTFSHIYEVINGFFIYYRGTMKNIYSVGKDSLHASLDYFIILLLKQAKLKVDPAV